MITQDKPFLTTRQASYYLGLSHFTLERLRHDGKGPVYRRHARYVMYHIDDLNAWSQANSSASHD